MRRGSPVLIVSYSVAMASAYGVLVALSRLFSPAEFGEYGIVNTALNVMNAVLAVGATHAVSRLIAARPGDEPCVRRAAMRHQALLAIALCGAFAALAPALASSLRDVELTRYFLLAAAIPGIYSLNAINLGVLNGTGRLGAQGSLNITLSATRLLFIVGLAALGLGLQGVLVGILVAALLTLLASSWLSSRAVREASSRPSGRPPVGFRAFAAELVPFMGTQALVQLLLGVDLFLVKRLSPVEVADVQAGLYLAAQSIARVPYLLLFGISQVAFSRVARQSARGAGDETRRFSALILAFLWVALVGIGALAVPLAEHLIGVLYPEEYRLAAGALRWLLLAAGALTLADAAQTMLSGARGPRLSLGILAVAVVVEVGGVFWWVPRMGLEGAAIGASVAALGGFALALLGLWRTLGTPLLFRPILLGVALALPLAALSHWVARLEPPRLVVVLYLGVAYLAFGALVAALHRRELRELLGQSAEATP